MPESTPEHQRTTSPADADSRDDRQLMARVSKGDAAAFDQIVQAHWQDTVSYARGLVNDADTAGDITQETFVRLWQARRTWKPTGSVRVWLFRTARNLSISEHRKRSVRARWAASQPTVELHRPRTPLQSAENEELRRAMADAIAHLSPRRREVFTLFHLRDLSYREVADVMGIREQSVANHLQAAIAQLRGSLRSFFPALADVQSPDEREDGDE
jgi:RNA polymerase sigma-70 factor (ECF subfamily)